MDRNNSIFKTLALITQIGISIMTPVFLLLFIGIVLKNKFNIDIIIFLIILGIISGIRNAYELIKAYLKSEDNTENKESELLKKHKDYISNK